MNTNENPYPLSQELSAAIAARVLDAAKNLNRYPDRDATVLRNKLDLAEECYRATKLFPKEEMYGMTSQIRRAAASVAANIAEGHGREHTGSFVQSLRVAQGSLKELETHVILAQRVGLLVSDTSNSLLTKSDRIGKMLRSLIRALQKRVEGKSLT
jgi:four helix bundle protein